MSLFGGECGTEWVRVDGWETMSERVDEWMLQRVWYYLKGNLHWISVHIMLCSCSVVERYREKKNIHFCHIEIDHPLVGWIIDRGAFLRVLVPPDRPRSSRRCRRSNRCHSKSAGSPAYLMTAWSDESDVTIKILLFPHLLHLSRETGFWQGTWSISSVLV